MKKRRLRREWGRPELLRSKRKKKNLLNAFGGERGERDVPIG